MALYNNEEEKLKLAKMYRDKQQLSKYNNNKKNFISVVPNDLRGVNLYQEPLVQVKQKIPDNLRGFNLLDYSENPNNYATDFSGNSDMFNRNTPKIKPQNTVKPMANIQQPVQNIVKPMANIQQPAVNQQNNKPVMQNINSMANTANNTLNTANNISNLANNVKTASDATNTASNAANMAGAASSSLSNAVPYVGAATSALNVGNELANGNYLDAGLDALSGGLMFIPGYGWAASAAIQAGKYLKNMFAKDQEEARQRVQEEANKSQKLVQKNMEKTQAKFDEPNDYLARINSMMDRKMSDMADTTNMSPTAQIANDFVNKEDTDDIIDQKYDKNAWTVLPKPEQDNTQTKLDLMNNVLGMANTTMGSVQNGTAQTQPTTQQNAQQSYNQQPGNGVAVDGNTTQSPLSTTTQTTEVNQNSNPIADYQDYMRGQGMSEEQINGLTQGLNYGNKDTAQWIQQYNESHPDSAIRIPQTEEEIALARNGQFNMPVQQGSVDTNRTLKDKLLSGVKDLYHGYQENSTTPFAPENFNRVPGKSKMNRFGEMLGTTGRMLSNPYLQGLVAGGVYGLTGGDLGESINYGVNWAQNKAKSDYYAKQLGQNPGVLTGNYDSKDYGAAVDANYKDRMVDINQQRADNQREHYENTAKNQETANELKRMYYDNQFALGKDRNAIARDKNAIDRARLGIYAKSVDNKINNNGNNVDPMVIRDFMGRAQTIRDGFKPGTATYDKAYADQKNQFMTSYAGFAGLSKEEQDELINSAIDEDIENIITDQMFDYGITLNDLKKYRKQ